MSRWRLAERKDLIASRADMLRLLGLYVRPYASAPRLRISLDQLARQHAKIPRELD